MTTLSRNPNTVYAKSEGERFNADTTLVCVNCHTCGVLYAIPESFNKAALRYRIDTANGWSICCPFGHTWGYVGETKLEKGKRQLRETKDMLARERARHDQTRANLTGARSAKTKFKNERDRLKDRAAAGVCPCCNRTFKQLSRHMAGQHPEFVKDQA